MGVGRGRCAGLIVGAAVLAVAMTNVNTVSASGRSGGSATSVDPSQLRVTSLAFLPAIRTESPKKFSAMTLRLGVSHPVGVTLDGPAGSAWIRGNRAPCSVSSMSCPVWEDFSFGWPRAKYKRVSPTYTVITARLPTTLIYDNGTNTTGAPKGLYRVAEVRLPYSYPCDENPEGGCAGSGVVAYPATSYRHAWATKTKITQISKKAKLKTVRGRAYRNKYTNGANSNDEVIGGKWKGWRKARLSLWFDPAGTTAPSRIKSIRVKRDGSFAVNFKNKPGGNYFVQQASQGSFYQSNSRRF